ncbi:MAG TPA: hypothetical protein VH165_36385 [Kofleriaceae bacterium]|jgi:hypothetical protein|nr:hypothetical protein [Kofleriaceae bacterium]
MITIRRTALFLALAFTAATGATTSTAFAKPSDQARKDAAAHAKKGNDSAARAAEKRANDRAAAEQRAQRNASKKR